MAQESPGGKNFNWRTYLKLCPKKGMKKKLSTVLFLGARKGSKILLQHKRAISVFSTVEREVLI